MPRPFPLQTAGSWFMMGGKISRKGNCALKKRIEDSLLVQGSILAAAGLVTKLLGFLYRVPMANLLGEQGNGIYSVAFSIYNIALTLSSYSLPSAVSKLISERLGRGERRSAERMYRTALIFALLGGLAAFAVLFFGADYLEHVYRRDGLARPLRVLAPTTLVVALLGVLRGWFQGRGNMVPTAVSQIVEQVVNVVVSLLAAWQLLRLHGGAASWGAAGGTLGTLAGAAAAMFLMALWVRRAGGRLTGLSARENAAPVWRPFLWTVVPMLLSQTVYQLGATVDDLLFGRAMEAKGVADAVAASLQGVYNSQYNQLTTLPVAITTAMAASLLPGIALYWSQGRRLEAMEKARTVIRLNMALAIPAAVGLGVLAGPIMEELYPRLTDYRDLAVGMLELGSSAVVFYALSTITAAVLQGSGRVHTPARNAALALVIHAVLVAALLYRTDLGVWALIVGNVTFPLTLSLLNCRAVAALGCRWELRRTFLLPLAVSVPMGLIALGVYHGLAALGLRLSLSLLAAVLAAVAFYVPALLRAGCFTAAELPQLPLSGFLTRLAGKRRR